MANNGERDPLEIDRGELQQYWRQLFEKQQHEDTLFNNRLAGFAIGTSLLLAALSQFREHQFLGIAGFICVAGGLLSALMWDVLRRTAQGLDENRRHILELEPWAFKPGLQPYTEFMKHRGFRKAREVNKMLGSWLPFGALLLWGFLFLWVATRLDGAWRAGIPDWPAPKDILVPTSPNPKIIYAARA